MLRSLQLGRTLRLLMTLAGLAMVALPPAAFAVDTPNPDAPDLAAVRAKIKSKD